MFLLWLAGLVYMLFDGDALLYCNRKRYERIMAWRWLFWVVACALVMVVVFLLMAVLGGTL